MKRKGRRFKLIHQYILKTVIISVIVLIHISAHADDLTYRNAVVDSLHHSPNLRMKVADIKISEVQYKASFAGLFPTINLSGRTERYENLDDRNTSGFDTIGNEVVGGYQNAWKSSLNLTGQYYFLA